MSAVALSEEQRELVAMVGRLVDDAAATSSPRAGQAVPFAADAWRGVVDAGLVGIGIGEEESGSGGTALDLALVVEALAAGPVAVPYLGSVLALGLLGTAADGNPPAARRRVRDLREQILAGRPGAVVLADDLAAPSHAGVVFDASDGCVVVGCADGTLSAGDTFEWLEGVDLTRRLGRARAGGTLATADPTRSTRWGGFALALLSADLVGAMSAALGEAVAHANQRAQFGRPVGSFQAVQQLCADQLVTVEAARSSLWHAAWAADAVAAPDARSAARVTKAYCSSGALEVCEAAVQVWGGLGMTWECRAHLFLRRVLLARRALGDENAHLAAIADDIAGTAPARPAHAG